MKKLYWCVQHVDEMGGAEMVSIDLMNHLVDNYDITCIATAEITKPLCYEIDKRIKVVSLNIPKTVTRFDDYANKYRLKHKYFHVIGLALKSFYYYFLRKGHYRRYISKLISQDEGKIICSSADNYLYCPKKHYAIFHYHFNSVKFFSWSEQALLKMSRKPDEYVFLSKSTLDLVVAKKKKLKDKSSYIFNPVRYEPTLNTTYNKNRILFLGRYADQKNPLLALEVAKELKQQGLSFSLDMFGKGALENKMREFIKENNLEDNVSINDVTMDVRGELLKSDLLLFTSKYEGFGLVKIEANACSRPVITSNWGDTVYDVTEDGKDGYVINSVNPKDFANKIIEILSNKETLAKLKETSYKQSYKFAYSNIIPSWIKLLG